jgi:hypothetical protein
LVLGILATSGFGVVCAIADSTAVEGNAYGVVSNRNLFHLNLPPATTAKDQKAVDVPELILNGFYKVGNNTRVLLAMPPKDQKDVTKYFNLAPGERDSSVEVVKIDADKGEVEIINSGKRMTLSFVRNSVGAKAAPGQPAGGPTPAAGVPANLQARALSPRALQSAAPLAAAGASASSGNLANATSGGDSGSLSDSASGSAYGGGIMAGRNFVGGGSSGAPSGSGNGSSTGGVIVSGGNSASAITSIGSYNSVNPAEGSAGVYFPPNPGSAAANMQGANVGNALANPQNSQYRTPPRPSGP